MHSSWVGGIFAMLHCSLKLSLAVIALAIAGRDCLWGQSPIPATGPSGAVLVYNTDSAVLEGQEVRKDLPCTVTPVKPALGFDLKFHSGYEVSIPLRELAGSDNLLTMIFRVIPENHKNSPTYFSQRMRVPQIEEDAGGNAYLQGSFDVGEGKYKIDWLMRDRSERVCSSYWEVEASLPPKDKDLSPMLSPGVVKATDTEDFKEEPPVERAQGEPPLNVKILVNFAPLDTGATVLQPLDTNALVSVLRTIAREPRIGKFSIVAFNLAEQRVVYRQNNADRIDFPALGSALRQLNLGTIDLKTLSQKHGDTEFLANLIRKELGGKDHPDAVVFAGPKALLEENVSQEALKGVGEPDYPVFYMNYNLNPQATPWRDAIGHAVKFYKGYEYTISRPRDLWYAVSEMVSRTLKLKNGKRASAAPSQ
jgi:hypothetical protein